MTDTLYLLIPGEDPAVPGEDYFCPPCAMVEGVLASSPHLGSNIEGNDGFISLTLFKEFFNHVLRGGIWCLCLGKSGGKGGQSHGVETGE